jgi:hypothetical protein
VRTRQREQSREGNLGHEARVGEGIGALPAFGHGLGEDRPSVGDLTRGHFLLGYSRV